MMMMLNHDNDCDDHDNDCDVHMKPFKVYLAQDVKHGFVALKTVDSQRMGVVSLKFSSFNKESPFDKNDHDQQ